MNRNLRIFQNPIGHYPGDWGIPVLYRQRIDTEITRGYGNFHCILRKNWCYTPSPDFSPKNRPHIPVDGRSLGLGLQQLNIDAPLYKFDIMLADDVFPDTSL